MSKLGFVFAVFIGLALVPRSLLADDEQADRATLKFDRLNMAGQFDREMFEVNPDLFRIGDPDLRMTGADLMPGKPGKEYCRFTDQGDLVVIVNNHGHAAAKASITTVTFYVESSIGVSVNAKKVQVNMPTPVIPGGGTIVLPSKIPSGCFVPDCSFTIRVDSDNRIPESNEANNEAHGGCIG